jgi:hypothetical protein
MQYSFMNFIYIEKEYSMNYLTPRAIILAAGFILISLHTAHAAPPTDIQMLPPLDFSNNTCAGANGGILYWDGATPIKCVPGSSGDANGNISASGGVTIGTNKPVPTTTVCQGTQAGTLSWMMLPGDTSPAVYVCDGTNWTKVGKASQTIEADATTPGCGCADTCPTNPHPPASFSTVNCPPGSQLTGGGYKITSFNPVGNLMRSNAPDGSYPLIGQNGWQIDAGGEPGYSCFIAYAICVQ